MEKQNMKHSWMLAVSHYFRSLALYFFKTVTFFRMSALFFVCQKPAERVFLCLAGEKKHRNMQQKSCVSKSSLFFSLFSFHSPTPPRCLLFLCLFLCAHPTKRKYCWYRTGGITPVLTIAERKVFWRSSRWEEYWTAPCWADALTNKNPKNDTNQNVLIFSHVFPCKFHRRRFLTRTGDSWIL